MTLITFLQENGMTHSRSIGRRLVACSQVKVNGVVNDDLVLQLKDGDIIECQGKKLIFKES